MIDIAEGIHTLRRYAVQRVDQPWQFAVRHRAEINRHWALRSRENPKFFNGRVHIMIDANLRGGDLQGQLVETDFASALYWRDTGFADASVADCFAAGIILCADNTLIYGRQAPGNVNAGLTYPPCGFLDPRDIGEDGFADLAASAAREVQEETGFGPAELSREPGFLAARQGPLLCIGIRYRSVLNSSEFLRQVKTHLAREDDPELEAMIALRRRSDTALHPMRDYAKWIAEHILAA